MSLVPYQPQEGREIVLRHRNAIVVHDPTSQRLEIRGINLGECPTCHRPLRSSSPERPHHYGDDGSHSSRHEGYVDPNYFRLLRAGGFSGLSPSLSGRSGGSSDGSGGGGGGGGGSGGGGTSGHDGGRVGGRPGAQAASNPFRRLFQPLVGGGGHDSSNADSHSSPRSTTPSDGHGHDHDHDHDHDNDHDHDHDHDHAYSPSFSDAEFVSSTPYVDADNHTTTTTTNLHNSSPISRQAFSPNYFNTFFIEERELGRGGKGVVLLVRHEIDGCVLGHFACKRVPVGDDHTWLEKVLVEVELLAKLSHPNLVSYRHVWLENKKITRFGPPVACAFILQQYCNGGDLHRFILGEQPKEATKEELKARMRRRSRGAGGSVADQRRPNDLRAALAMHRTGSPVAPSSSLPSGPSPPTTGTDTPSSSSASGSGTATRRRLAFDEIYSLFKDITSGLAYLHAANYIHRDLKPSNCLLHRGEGRNGTTITCLISDFGEVQPENVVRKSTGTTGTLSYCAPEVLRIDPATGLYGNFTTKSDVFSLGMILYFMCFGCLPYRSANAVNEDLEDVDKLRLEITAWRGFRYERRARADLPSKLYELLTEMLSVDPNQRPSANEVLLAMRTTTDGAFGGGGGGGGGSGGGVTSAGPSSMPLSPSSKPSATLGVPSLVSGRRIQNLDSPEPSTSPVPDPSKHDSPMPHIDDLDESVFDDSDDPLTASSSSPLLRARKAKARNVTDHAPHLQDGTAAATATATAAATSTSLALTRSHGSHSQSPGRSTPRGNRGPQATHHHHHHHHHHEGAGNELSPVRRGRQHLDDDDVDDAGTRALSPMLRASVAVATAADEQLYGTHGTPMTTPTFLLMPPPPTYWGELRHQALVAQYHATIYLHRHAEAAAFVARGILFLAKMVSLSRLCWPYMFQTAAGILLVTLAGLDLGLPRRRPATMYQHQHQHHQHHQHEHEGQSVLFYWSWRMSIISLVLHFTVLWVAGRYHVLCTGSPSSSVQFEDWLAG